jgi:hypothetical protein
MAMHSQPFGQTAAWCESGAALLVPVPADGATAVCAWEYMCHSGKPSLYVHAHPTWRSLSSPSGVGPLHRCRADIRSSTALPVTPLPEPQAARQGLPWVTAHARRRALCVGWVVEVVCMHVGCHACGAAGRRGVCWSTRSMMPPAVRCTGGRRSKLTGCACQCVGPA